MTQPRSVESEQQTRESLAALYRILDRYGMSDLAPVFFICGLVLVEQATKIFIIRRVVGEYNLGTGAI